MELVSSKRLKAAGNQETGRMMTSNFARTISKVPQCRFGLSQPPAGSNGEDIRSLRRRETIHYLLRYQLSLLGLPNDKGFMGYSRHYLLSVLFVQHS